MRHVTGKAEFTQKEENLGTVPFFAPQLARRFILQLG